MTDNEIRIAIAEACGWEWRRALNAETYAWFSPKEGRESEWISSAIPKITGELPDYPNDLNAIQNAVTNYWHKLLNGDEPTLESESFLVSLGEHAEKLLHDDVEWSLTPAYRFLLISPRLFCEAFLRTIGKWKE